MNKVKKAERTSHGWFENHAPAWPEKLDRATIDARLEDLRDAAREADADRLLAEIEKRGAHAAFLGGVFGASTFLRDALRRNPLILEDIFDRTISARVEELTAEIASLRWSGEMPEKQLMAELRRLKGQAHALIALGDLAGEFDAADTVRQLSDLADAAIAATARYLLREAHESSKVALPDPDNPEEGSGWIILGMGKLGAHELNFSSDIDLVVFFDPEAEAIKDPLEATDIFARLTRRLAHILHERTDSGYVFRTDLRLRPDPGATPLAIPVNAALHYYESRGQNWERAAMIKARPVAGDRDAARAFLKELQPYIWRKYMDFAAIADVHSIKRQIHAHKGHGEIAVRGHNVKLGRGGIREIEFFVQTQQLIAGGRFPELRGRGTVDMLSALTERGWISEEVRDALVDQYWFLRNVEHAIQMVADEQSHVLPEDDEGLANIAHLRGFASAREFSDAFRTSLQTVEQHYAALFETAPELSGSLGNLVFTGDIDDPDTLETLSSMGFKRPSDISRIIRTWHFGRYRATQSAEARERLTEITPALLQAFGETKRADEALVRFDEFLSGLPAGIQLFSLLQTNPRLLKLLANIMGTAPRLAGIITRRPHVFDGLLDPALLSELPNKAYLAERLEAFLAGAIVHEELLDRLRIFAAEQKFLIGVRLLTGAIDATRAGKAFSDLADLSIGAALGAVEAEFARRHGRIAGGRMVVLGMGKLGSRELTAGSDVDLILLYDHDAEADESDGDKPLAPPHYFARLTQRLIAAVSAPTAEGVLYELDLRLRPSGNKGPIATNVEAFEKYQRESAWTWEHMALTRARVVTGDAELGRRVAGVIDAIIAMPRNVAKLRADAAEMRKLIEQEKPPANIWDFKLISGGIIDLEFIGQVLMLERSGAGEGGSRSTGTADMLAHAPQDRLSHQERQQLLDAHGLYMALTQRIRLCLTGDLDPEDIPAGLADLLLATADLPELSVLEAHLRETSKTVRGAFVRLMRKPA